MRLCAAGLVAILMSASSASAEFAITFEWGNIPLCTSGRPNTVPSPRFTVRDLPAGTTSVRFKLTDLDAPRYDHGGATLGVTRSGVLPAGAFSYKSPCPPGGVHIYEWTATARKGNRAIGTAKARRRYPE